MKKTLGLMAILTALGACEMGGMGSSGAPAEVTPDECTLDVPNRPPSATCDNDEA